MTKEARALHPTFIHASWAAERQRERAGERQRGKESAEILFQAPKATPPNASIQS